MAHVEGGATCWDNGNGNRDAPSSRRPIQGLSLKMGKKAEKGNLPYPPQSSHTIWGIAVRERQIGQGAAIRAHVSGFRSQMVLAVGFSEESYCATEVEVAIGELSNHDREKGNA